jgi:phosphodiesterase/alkaline phosphatase D-like protein
VPPIAHSSPTASSPATSRSIPLWSGRAPIVPRACWPRSRPPTVSRRSTARFFVDALPESDFTAKALIGGLPAGQDIFYRIRFQGLSSPTIVGEPMTGRFRTAPGDRRSISFVWSGDTAGQGWGIDEARGGMRTYATMLRNRPDFFIHKAIISTPTVQSSPSRKCRTARFGKTS